MLETLDAPDWANLAHAYGRATDVPDQIRALRSPDRTVREKALGELYANVFHQGTRYEASAAAVPFLLELLADPSTPMRPALLGLLTGLAIGYDEAHLPTGYEIAAHREAAEGGPELLAGTAARVSAEQDRQDTRPEPADAADEEEDDEEEDDEEEDDEEEDELPPLYAYLDELTEPEQCRVHAFFELAAYDAVRAGLPLVRDLLGAEDPAIRAAAAHALAWFPEEAPAVLPALIPLADDPDPVVAATALVAVGLLATPERGSVMPLLEAVLDDPRELVRWGAATALVRLNGPGAGHRAAEELRSRLAGLAERGDEIPFFDGDVRGHAALSLCLLDDAYTEDTFTALLASLPEVSGTEALPVAQAALRLAFPERALPEETPFAALDDRQRRLVRVLAESPGTWLLGGRRFGNFMMLVRSYGLPGDVEAMAAYMAGTP
ncbi:HEAT repeat domain-containing protein [Streptomyces sp. NPDC014622]|uniref:HEAT repeat domain-containing protein n=1 Tax=Streptomyces sp. NPDC014622 TaxID=3364874 RepID=UPI0036F953EE